MGAGEVIAYYEECSPAYRKHHSREGSMHLAISPGRFRAEGFYGQARSDLRFLAGRDRRTRCSSSGSARASTSPISPPDFPRCGFSGIDLTPTHPGLAQSRLDQLGLKNVVLAEGDFHALPYADASFDHVYAVEAFSYARDVKQALSEVARVLRPGGTFRLFDGYLARRPDTFSADEALAAELLAKSMAFERFQLVDDVIDTARAVGLKSLGVISLDAEVAPNLKKLERLTGAVIRFPWLGRRALAKRSPMRGRNVIAGYLMYSTLMLGLTGYREILLHKPD